MILIMAARIIHIPRIITGRDIITAGLTIRGRTTVDIPGRTTVDIPGRTTVDIPGRTAEVIVTAAAAAGGNSPFRAGCSIPFLFCQALDMIITHPVFSGNCQGRHGTYHEIPAGRSPRHAASTGRPTSGCRSSR